MFEKYLLDDNVSKKSRKAPLALILFGSTVGGLTILITAVSTPFIFPFFRRICLPYVPATAQQIQNVLEGLRGRTGTLLDLGSGDGRIVLAAAQQGFFSTGVEINPWLILYSRFAASKAGLQGRTKFIKANLWQFDLKPYRNIVIFGTESMMPELEKKLSRELQRNSMIVACRFPLAHMEPVKTIGVGIDTVWVYKIS